MSRKLEIVAILQAAVQSEDCPIEWSKLCEALDKAPGTLYNELNPWQNPDCRNKLGVEDAFTIMTLTGDTRMLDYMASRMGYRLVSLADVCPDKPTLPEELLDDIPSLAAYHDAIRQGLPVEAVNAVLQLAIKDLEQDFVAYRAEREKGQKRRKVA